ncbi:MAG: DUF839 domain-containing protein [Deltaproteobacteria bacterium]|nr:DUF839 domain-containing protein [Deltaproteobacteria bacterium]
MDRRKFLFQSTATVGGLLASPRLGLLAVAAGAMAGTLAQDSDSPRSENPPRPLLRSGEPINSRGHPLGHGIAALTTVSVPTAAPGTRIFAVVAHGQARTDCNERIARRSVGFSTLEFTRENGRWQHEVASVHNRRWDLETPIPIEGARLVADQAAYRVQEMQPGTGCVNTVAATPWQTVLCGERDGWVVEVNPLSGHAVKRFSLGRVGARSIELVAKPGMPVAVYLLGDSHYFKFVSHQRFEARQIQVNSSILLIGELSVADLAAGQWVALTADLKDEAWAAQLREPLCAPNLPAPFSESPASELLARLRGADAAWKVPDSSFFVEQDEAGSIIFGT